MTKRCDEGESGVGDFAPAVVDGERVAATGDLDDLGDALVALLLLVEAFAIAQGTVWSFSPEMISSGPRSGFLVVDLRLGPRVEVGGRGLEERRARGRHRVGVVELLGLVLADGVGERVAELLVGQRDRAVRLAGLPSTGDADLARRSAAAARPGTVRGRWRRTPAREPAAGEDLREQPAEGVTDQGRLLVELPMTSA